jgi:glycosyltransferase involved in cell wall biosynthesis
MACGCPVVCSNVTSLPAVAGEAGLLIDPRDSCGLAGLLDELGENEALRRDLAAKGLERSREFSWRKAAEETLAVFKGLKK